MTNTSPKTVAFHTLGCKLNFAETSTIARQLIGAGYEKVEFDDPAQVYVINTCSVTDNADKECKFHVKRAVKANPDGLVVVLGCYAQLKPEEISAIEGVDLVLGAKEKFNLLNFLDDLRKSESSAQVHSCDAQQIAQQDIKEIVLTGVNIGDYGKGEFGNKKHEHTFLDLVTALNEVDGIERIRISSIEPNLLKDETIELVAKSKSFVPHFHIPLQSGSDEILKKMKRRYLTALYTSRVNKIREILPDAAIGVDVIVGFPGETEEKFLETYNFLAELPISYLHVFTYSERDNTEAVSMEGVVPISERKRRNKMLRILSEKKKMAFYQTQLGKILPVLWEHEEKNGMMFGFTDNYVRVQKPYDEKSVNRVERVKLEKISKEGNVVVSSSFEEFLTKV